MEGHSVKLRSLLIPLAAAALAASAVALPAIAGTQTKREHQLQTRLTKTTNAMVKARADAWLANQDLRDANTELATAKSTVVTRDASITTLQAQIADLQGKLTAAQVDAAASKTLAQNATTQLQQGISTQIAAMDPPTAFALLPLIANRMGGNYESSIYSASGYRSWTFTWSSCC